MEKSEQKPKHESFLDLIMISEKIANRGYPHENGHFIVSFPIKNGDVPIKNRATPLIIPFSLGFSTK